MSGGARGGLQCCVCAGRWVVELWCCVHGVVNGLELRVGVVVVRVWWLPVGMGRAGGGGRGGGASVVVRNGARGGRSH